jgi:hypothetical protein
MQEAVQLVSTAAQASDRWLFIASLAVMGVVIYYVARYFVRVNSDDRAEHKADRSEWEKRRVIHEETLAGLVRDGHTTMTTLSTVLASNSAALQECNRHLNQQPLPGDRRSFS